MPFKRGLMLQVRARFFPWPKTGSRGRPLVTRDRTWTSNSHVIEAGRFSGSSSRHQGSDPAILERSRCGKLGETQSCRECRWGPVLVETEPRGVYRSCGATAQAPDEPECHRRHVVGVFFCSFRPASPPDGTASAHRSSGKIGIAGGSRSLVWFGGQAAGGSVQEVSSNQWPSGGSNH